MNLELNGHARLVGTVAAWAIRALIAVLAAILVTRTQQLDLVANTSRRLENRLTRVEAQVEVVREQLAIVQGRVYYIQRRVPEDPR